MTTIAEAATLPELTTDELSRYSRHLILPEVGMEGQQKLKAARVLCVGTGGLVRRWRSIWLPPALAPSAWSTSTWWMQAIFSARSSTLPKILVARNLTPQKRSSRR